MIGIDVRRIHKIGKVNANYRGDYREQDVRNPLCWLSMSPFNATEILLERVEFHDHFDPFSIAFDPIKFFHDA